MSFSCIFWLLLLRLLCITMAAEIASTMGMWLLSVFLESILMGMGLLQCFLYFVWYHKDPWSFKLAVILIVSLCLLHISRHGLQCIQMGASFANVYDWFINNFGNFERLRFIGWPDSMQLAALYLSVFVAQIHFARCIYHLQKENIILPLIILLLALLAVGAGLGQVIVCIQLGEYAKLGQTKLTTNLQAAAALVADTLITFGLCWRLNQGRGGIQSTNKVLNFLIMTAVNRGALTIVLAALNMVLFFATPGTFDFMIVLFLSDKFYMNSMLAMLNTREYAVNSGKAGAVVERSYPIFEASNPNVRSSCTITVSTSQITRFDESYVEMGKVPV
ncbi:hypothetical protein MVEN_02171700 [Mycena venus]|uniref:DUF6534 domain-containing protein n=1 Tax=Mycena venus TaxID=2733690 RepID=A0A8H7CI41_9AGAR|nr:hypothetical protein MVEN_02171700 [Mycena venus]